MIQFWKCKLNLCFDYFDYMYNFRWTNRQDPDLVVNTNEVDVNGVVWDFTVNRSSFGTINTHRQLRSRKLHKIANNEVDSIKSLYDTIYAVGDFDALTSASQVQYCGISKWDNHEFSKVCRYNIPFVNDLILFLEYI